jgi:plastocyanin
MRGYLILLGILVALPSGTAAPVGGIVTGHVLVFQNGKKLDPLDASAYVYLVENPLKHHKDRPGDKIVRPIEHRNLEFSPHAIAVPLGATIEFPNNDDVEHNAFSPTPNDPFDLGRYSHGAHHKHRFFESGEFDIYCDIHKDMWAKIKVVDSPWIAEVKNGAFTLADIPDGEYKVVAWFHDSIEVRSDPIQIKAGATTALPVELHVQVGKPKSHTRKAGGPYPQY